MKKFLLLVVGIIAACVVVANLGPLITLAVCLGLLYLIFRQFMRTHSVIAKIGWMLTGIVLFAVSVAHMYALVGVLAAYFLFVIIRKWKKEDAGYRPSKNNDPFTNFERQWAEMKK